jgi:DMSO/TMAO reductase YedYZ molybdopterin-dependent catalytic subunit
MSLRRTSFLTLLGGALSLTGCSKIATTLTNIDAFHKVLDAPERLNLALLGAGQPLAREYSEADVAPVFRHNGFDPPSDSEYTRWSQNGWNGYRLFVSGLVQAPKSYDLSALRSKFPKVAQITRHDCVEGWSVIGKWSGALLADVLADCNPTPEARYVVFHCMDDDGSGVKYYESLNLRQAAHPQALLAYELNDKPVPLQNGAPLRLKVPTQLGYKSAKHINRIELVAGLGGDLGRGGYWEDRGYEWFAGI